MRFKKGDKVWMVWKSTGIPRGSSMRGIVVGVNDRHYSNPKMMVRLENGDFVIQDIDDPHEAWVAFKPDFRVVSSIGRAKGF